MRLILTVAGMSISGAGAGINELTALAVTSELAPTRQRGTYVAVLIFTIIPFCPSVLWGQLIASHAGWRYCGALCGAWAAVGLVLTLAFYFPPPRVNSTGLSRMEILKRIDYVGGFLSISGMICFMAGLQWGGYQVCPRLPPLPLPFPPTFPIQAGISETYKVWNQYPWSSTHVLAPLIIGIFLIVAFLLWEWKGAAHPMFPARLKQAPRIFYLTLIITFVSGANFFSVLLFWPTQAYNVYGHDPVGVGIRGLPVGFAILTGACLVLWLLSALRGRNRELMIVSSVLMTAGLSRHVLSTRCTWMD